IMKKYYCSIVIVLISFLVFNPLLAQDNQAKRYRADKYFEIKNYAEARGLYEELIAAGENDPLLRYKAGVSYLEDRNIQLQLKGLPHLEVARKSNDPKLPKELNYYLGVGYHKAAEIHKAIDFLTNYKKSLTASEKAMLNATDRQLGQAQ